MKHFCTLALASFLSLSMISQTSTMDKATEGRLVHPTEAMAPEMESRDVFWSNDISNCADWTFGNGAAETGSPWQDIDLNFECTTVGSAGFFNGWAGGNSDGTPAPGINSTSSGNFLMVDSDRTAPLLNTMPTGSRTLGKRWPPSTAQPTLTWPFRFKPVTAATTTGHQMAAKSVSLKSAAMAKLGQGLRRRT